MAQLDAETRPTCSRVSRLAIPVTFTPTLKAKPWGGNALARLFGRAIPEAETIGESWEVADLADTVATVRGGPLAGTRLDDLRAVWGPWPRGIGADDGRFPLLIKFLDAREALSVQVHPCPEHADSDGLPIKHEAWYVVDAEPGAVIYAGLKPGVTPTDLARHAGEAGCVDLLRTWPVTRGDCFYLPSGTVHALGAGVVVAEVQTPSDVTYRLYDWDRTGTDGSRRDLHLEQALRHARFDVRDDDIRPLAVPCDSGRMRRIACDHFAIDEIRIPPKPGGVGDEPDRTPICLDPARLCIWIVLEGAVSLDWSVATTAGATTNQSQQQPNESLALRAGEVGLLPGAGAVATAGATPGAHILEVTLTPARV